MTERLFTLDADPFDLLDGVPRDLLDADTAVKLAEGATYLRVDAAVMDDQAMADVLADAGTVGVAAWFVLLATAKLERQYGIVDLHAQSFGAKFGASAADTLAAIDAMERAGLVWVRRDPEHRYRLSVRVRNWHEWQSLTDAERKRLERRRSSGKSGHRPENADAVRIIRSSSTHEDEDEEIADAVFARAGEPAPMRKPAPVREADTWWQEAAATLVCIHQDQPAVREHVAQQIADHAFGPKHRGKNPPEAYQRAAVAFQRDFDAGKRLADHRKAVPYYLSTVASYRVALPDPTPPPPDGGPHGKRTTRQLAVSDKFARFD